MLSLKEASLGWFFIILSSFWNNWSIPTRAIVCFRKSRKSRDNLLRSWLNWWIWRLDWTKVTQPLRLRSPCQAVLSLQIPLSTPQQIPHIRSMRLHGWSSSGEGRRSAKTMMVLECASDTKYWPQSDWNGWPQPYLARPLCFRKKPWKRNSACVHSLGNACIRQSNAAWPPWGQKTGVQKLSRILCVGAPE